MYGYEHVSPRLVGNVGTFVQLHKHISLACIYNLNILAVIFNQLTHLERYVQVDRLLLVLPVNGARVLSAVPWVNHKHKPSLFVNCLGLNGSQHTQGC